VLTVEKQEMEQFECEFKRHLSVSIKSSENNENGYLSLLLRMQEGTTEGGKWKHENEAFLRVSRKVLGTVERTNKMDVALISLAEFLWSYETDYMNCVDLVCYLLTNNGHDLLNIHTNKYAVTFEDVGDISAFVKFEFLKAHDFRMLIRKNDKDLRNSIAHHNFLLGEDGTIKVKGEPIDIFKRNSGLLCFTSKFWRSFTKCFKECASDKEPTVPTL